MVERSARTIIDPDFIDGGPWIPHHAWRFLLWGGAAFLATVLVALAAWTQAGSQRLADFRASDGARSVAGQSRPGKSTEADAEIRRLALTLHDLSNDRDRLLARIATLERNLEEVTGSITGSLHPSRPPGTNPGASPLPPGALLAPVTIPPSAAAQSAAVLSSPGTAQTPLSSPSPSRQSGAAPAQDPPPPVQVHAALPPAARAVPSAGVAAPSPSDTTVTKTEFGIDLGGDLSIDGLRSLWASLRGNHTALLEGLRPVVAIREGQKPNSLELRLVAGPLANAAAAARHCAALAVSGIACQPTVFDGQRLALR